MKQKMKINQQFRTIRENLNDKIYKDMYTVSKNVYINEPPKLVDEYNKAIQRRIKMKLEPNLYINFDVQVNTKMPKFIIFDDL